MGVVYRARDTHLERDVAVKTLPHVSSPAAVRLRREARSVAAATHPNLALIYGAETWRGRPMLVFEHLAGGTLADRISSGPVPVAEVMQIGVALAGALVAIHRVGLLHRDIKPSNIGFTADGVVKLLDFGLARVLTSIAEPASGRAIAGEVPVTTDSLLQGTPLYMSPEALLGAAPEAAFDTWSLSMVLYEAVAGAHPWRTGLPGAAGSERFVIPDVRTFAPGTPARVADVLREALALDRSNRPRNASELERRLRGL
jgi:serine/threonine-protein kinase